MSGNMSVDEMVISVVRKFCPGMSVNRNSTLLGELNLLSDDATAIILELERRLKVRAPRDEWSVVSTVQDVIDVLERHAPERLMRN